MTYQYLLLASSDHDLQQVADDWCCVQPFGISCADNVVKECAEEASVPKELAQAAKPAGAVSYHAMYPHGLKRDVLMCYDLELPQQFEPQPQVLLMSWHGIRLPSRSLWGSI